MSRLGLLSLKENLWKFSNYNRHTTIIPDELIYFKLSSVSIQNLFLTWKCYLIKKIIDSSLFYFEVKVFLFVAHAQDEGVLLLLGLANQECPVVRAIVA